MLLKMQDSNFKIDKNEVLRYLGYRDQTLDNDFCARLNEISAHCLSISKPRFHFEIFPLTANDNICKIENISLLGKDIKLHLNGASFCAVMAATLGIETDREFLRLRSRNITDALIFDASCTALIESVADECERTIAKVSENIGCFLNSRYSPGYGDFPLSQQHDLLGIIDAERKLGITLTDTFLMLPRKSVSAVTGLFKKPAHEISRNCSSCFLRDKCNLRKDGKTCER